MSPDEAQQAIEDQAEVVLRSALDRHEYARGRIISYSLVPTVTIELEPGGSRISWRHDLAELAHPATADKGEHAANEEPSDG